MPNMKIRGFDAHSLALVSVAILGKVKISRMEMYEALKDMDIMLLRRALYEIPRYTELFSQLRECIRYIQGKQVEDRPASYLKLGCTASSPAVIPKETSTSNPLPELASSCSAVSKETTAHGPTPVLALGASSLVNADIKVASPAIDEECVQKQPGITFQAERPLISTEDVFDTPAIDESLPPVSKKQEESDMKVVLTSAIDEVCVQEEQGTTLPEGQSVDFSKDPFCTPTIDEILTPVSNEQGESGYALAFSQDAVIMLSSGASLEIKRGDQLILQGEAVVLISSEPPSKDQMMLQGAAGVSTSSEPTSKDEQESGTNHNYAPSFRESEYDVILAYFNPDKYPLNGENSTEKLAINITNASKIDVIPEMAFAVSLLIHAEAERDKELPKIKKLKAALDKRLDNFKIPHESCTEESLRTDSYLCTIKAYLHCEESKGNLSECESEFQKQLRERRYEMIEKLIQKKEKKKLKKKQQKMKKKMVNPTSA